MDSLTIGVHSSISPTAGTTADPATRSGSGGVARRAADAITNLAHENLDIKNMVRREGGIAPLVRLLSSWDMKVQRAGAGALRTLAFKNDDNKRQIVDAGALPLLVQVGCRCPLLGAASGNLLCRLQDANSSLQQVSHTPADRLEFI